MNVYGATEAEAEQEARQIASEIDSKYDNRARVSDLASKPFGMRKGREIQIENTKKNIKKHFLAEKYERLTGRTLSESTEETGLMVYGSSQKDNNLIKDIVSFTDFSYYAEWNPREGYWFFPEDPEKYDMLEQELTDIFTDMGISARFEGIF